MKVTLIAHTILSHADSSGGELFAFEQDSPYLSTLESTDADDLAEFAGRSCYESYNRPNPETATNEAYLANIIKQKHFSVLEHASATFYITGISRALTHELIRHRHLSYSQLSQRFVDSKNAKVIIPPAIQALPAGERENAIHEIEDAFRRSILDYEYLNQTLEDHGCTRKEAREAARAVLPNATETKIVVTGNMRAWREFVEKRNAEGADAEIRELAKRLLIELKEIAPSSFQDMEI